MKKLNTTQIKTRAFTLEEEIEQLRGQLASLQDKRDLMAFILDSIPDYVSFVDADLTYKLCNRKYETETGRPCEEFLGNHVVEFVGEQGLAKIQPHLERVLKGEPVTYEDRIDYKHSEQQDVQVQLPRTSQKMVMWPDFPFMYATLPRSAMPRNYCADRLSMIR